MTPHRSPPSHLGIPSASRDLLSLPPCTIIYVAIMPSLLNYKALRLEYESVLPLYAHSFAPTWHL